MKRPRSGIIGTGFMGAVHARAVRAAGGAVSAVAATSRTRAEAMGASQVSELAAAIDGAAPDGLPAFTDGLRAARLTAAVLESARNGHWQVIR
jgi:predicted dehydrogenase